MGARRLLVLIALVAPLCGWGCSAPRDALQEADRALAEGRWGQAERGYAEALRGGRLRGLDRQRAQVGEARAFLAQGDLVNAENRLRRLDDTISSRWYYLGEVALARGDLSQAESCYASALERAHGGDTALKLARLRAGEAARPGELLAAVPLLERGGRAADAAAAAAAGSVWREALAGQDAAPLLARLEAALSPGVREFPCVQVLRAWLLEAAGRGEEAAPLWDTSGLRPAPTAEFLARASAARVARALARGDSAALERALAAAPRSAGRELRDRLARARLERGDLEGARVLWAGAADDAEATCQAANLAELLGDPLGKALWSEVRPDSGPAARCRLALRQAARGDLLGAARQAEAVATASLAPDLAADRDGLLRAAGLAEAAGEALLAGDAAGAAGLARSLLLLQPGDPTGLALLAASGEPGPVGRAQRLDGPPGVSGEVLDGLRLALLLRAGQLGPAATLLGAGPPERLRAALARELLAGVRAALAAGDEPGLKTFLAAVSPGLGPESRAALLERYPGLLPAGDASGLAARRPQPRAAVGALLGPRGRELPRVQVEHPDAGWSLTTPAGTRGPYGWTALVELLGGQPDWLPSDADPAEPAAWEALRAAPPWPLVAEEAR